MSDCLLAYSIQLQPELQSRDKLTNKATSLYQQHKQRPCPGRHLLLKHLVTLTMDCVMDGVNHPQTYLTGHAKEEVLHLQIRGLHQITLPETVCTILYIHTYYK